MIRIFIADDDVDDLEIFQEVLAEVLPDADICCATDGIVLFENLNKQTPPLPNLIFLDINMPTLSAWEFLELYEQFNEVIKSQITIYILSSSVHKSERDKAAESKYIKGFISKPLKSDLILTIINKKEKAR